MLNILENAEAAKIPSVCILMATYNGERFLEEQLESIANQTELDWVLWASDDGSSDGTRSILQNFAKRFPLGRVNVIDGPREGFAINFLSLVRNPNVRAKNYAYSDQDDVWVRDKLRWATEYLDAMPQKIPALYCSRTEYVDEKMSSIGYSKNYQSPPSFFNALVQNIASGNTMVFNQEARNLILNSGKNIKVPLHDWWTYIVVTACGGRVLFDKRLTVYYRQHDGNLWGMNTGWFNRMVRIKNLFAGRYRSWNEIHINQLNRIKIYMTSENQDVLTQFILIRSSKLYYRILYLLKSGLYRHGLIGNLGLLIAAIFRRI